VAELVLLRAGWALWGKQAGTRQDYSVTACSSQPFSRTEFAAIISRFAVGSPDPTAAGPAALPWVTVSWVGVDDDPHLGISVTRDSGLVDGVGRPITQTAYFCVPYAQLAMTPVSYCDLYDAVAAQLPSLHPADGAPVELSVPALSPEALADTVRRAGEAPATAAAALALSRPVSVVQAERTSLRDRLEFIDAVASLLPYGYRVRFSGATWSDAGAKHRVRIAFGARAREDAAVVTWHRAVDIPGPDRRAAAYCAQLRRLTQDPSQARDGLGLAAVIRHLAADAEPGSFDQPQRAADSLHLLDQPFRLVRAVRDGTGADLDDLRQLFRFGRARELRSETDNAVLLADLAVRAARDDWPLLRGQLASLRSREDQVRIVQLFGRRMLWTAPAHPERAAECLRLAGELGAEDDVLAELVRPPDHPAEGSADPQAAARLLAATVSRPAAGRFPRTRDAMAAAPETAADYVAALAPAGSAGPLLHWLDPDGGSVFARAFRAVLGIDEQLVSESDLAELSTGGLGCVRALLAAASAAGHLDRVLSGLTFWLAGQGEPSTADGRFWRTCLPRLSPRGPRWQAWLDTALLIAGGDPTGLPPVQPAAGPDYGSDMAGIWTGLARRYPSFDPELCAHALAGYLGGQPWTASQAQALAVTSLVRLLADFDPDMSLRGSVASRLAATPAAQNWTFAQEWLAWAADNEPEAVRRQLLDSLAGTLPSTDPEYLAGLCATACGRGADAGQVFSALAKSGALTTARQAELLIIQLLGEFTAVGIDEETAIDWQFRLSEHIASGAFGQELGHEVRRLVSARSRRDIWLELRLMATFAEEGRERQYEWTEAEREELAAIAAEIDSMLKKRKFQLPKRLRMPFGGAAEGAPASAAAGQETVIAGGPVEVPGIPGAGFGRQDTIEVPHRK
jgi:hypothetical protein